MANLSVPLLNLASTTETASGTVELAALGMVTTCTADITITAISGTSPTAAFVVERLGLDGNWYTVWAPVALTAIGAITTSIGPGCAQNAVITGPMRLRWTLGGVSPVVTLSASFVGR